MFYNQKISSLVNRFHTSGNDDMNNELITAKSKYGLSRGRNLLATEVDSSTGYENPYCRVWTAHHQYGKVNTMIRPFKGELSNRDVQDMYNGTSGHISQKESSRSVASIQLKALNLIT